MERIAESILRKLGFTKHSTISTPSTITETPIDQRLVILAIREGIDDQDNMSAEFEDILAFADEHPKLTPDEVRELYMKQAIEIVRSSLRPGSVNDDFDI